MLKDFQGDFPKGEARKQLKRRGRLNSIQFTRTMSSVIDNKRERDWKRPRIQLNARYG